MKKLLKTKKGDVPVTILVIGVVAICALALFSFFHSTTQIKSFFEGVGKISDARIEIEQNSLDYFYDEINKIKFKISLDEKWFQEKVVFSVEYNRK